MRSFFVNNLKECPECKKQFSLFLYDTKDYVYKIKQGGAFTYLCSYPCYRKLQAKMQIIKEQNNNARKASKGTGRASRRICAKRSEKERWM